MIRVYQYFLPVAFFTSLLGSCSQAPLRNPASASANPGIFQMQKTIAQITPLPALQDALKIHPVCQIKCAGQKSGSFDALAETFFPQNEYRTEANGGLVPLLSARLQLLGDQACESTAIDRCRGKDRVEEVRAMSLHSGTWKIQLPLDCQKSRGYVLSPYGSLYEGKTKSSLPFEPASGALLMQSP